jgi:gas vesicle protein
MSEDYRISKLGYFLVGSGIGAIIALLFAPRSGQETRDMIALKANESKDRITSAGRSVLDRGKDLVNTQKDQISSAIEAGKQAYREEKAKTQLPTE